MRCVYCKRPYEKDSKISFHRFSKDLAERKKWLQNMNFTEWSPKKYDSLCSLHFDAQCLVKHFNRTSLKPDSIPTIFEGTSTCPSLPSLLVSTPSPPKSSSPPCPMSFESINSHFDLLIKQIITKYNDVRLFAATKNHAVSITGQNIRNFLTRQIIWARQ